MHPGANAGSISGINKEPEQEIHTCPKLTAIKPASVNFCFLRLYSARYGHHKVSASLSLSRSHFSVHRIYFIVSNLSLACLTMPHSSHPVDDSHAPPFD